MGWTVRRQHRGVALCVFFLLVLTGVGASAEPLTLMWDPSPDASVQGYVVYIGSASRSYSSGVDVGSSTSFDLPALDGKKRYYIAVASYDVHRVVGEPSVELVWGQGAPPITVEPGTSPISGTSPTTGQNSDTKAPVIAVTTPTTSERSQTFGQSVVIGGVAKDDHGVLSVDWRNNRGESGQATGTETWLAAIPLHKGINEVRITARDAAGNRATTVLMLFRHPLGVGRAK